MRRGPNGLFQIDSRVVIRQLASLLDQPSISEVGSDIDSAESEPGDVCPLSV